MGVSAPESNPRTYSDWFDGDEDDIYRCKICGERIVEYVPR